MTRSLDRLRASFRWRAFAASADLLDALGRGPPSPAGGPVEYAILFVCLGNICRSPLAEGVLRAKLAREGLLGPVIAGSAGTSGANPGRKPDPRARLVARRHRIGIADLRARRFEPDDFDHFDRIVVFDEENRTAVLAHARNEGDRQRVELLLGDEGPLADPILGSLVDFERAFGRIDAACERLVEEAKERLRIGWRHEGPRH